MRPWFVPALLLIGVLAGGCSEISNGAGQISQKIGRITQDPNAREIDLAGLTSFGWDRFYLFPAGTTREQICRFIGAGRNQCGRIVRYLAVPDGHAALIFGLREQLTHTELHALVHGEFGMTIGEEGHPKEKSVFAVRRMSIGTGRDHVVLEPK